MTSKGNPYSSWAAAAATLSVLGAIALLYGPLALR
jgi:hypothetical protein